MQIHLVSLASHKAPKSLGTKNHSIQRRSAPLPPKKRNQAHLHHIQVLPPLLDQLLDLSGVLDILILPERIPRPAFGVLSEVVVGKLAPLTEKLPVL